MLLNVFCVDRNAALATLQPVGKVRSPPMDYAMQKWLTSVPARALALS